MVLSDNTKLIADSQKRYVNCLLQDGSMEVIAGSGAPLQQFGPGERAAFGQPTAIFCEGRSAYVDDTANATISILTGSQGLIKYVAHIDKV